MELAGGRLLAEVEGAIGWLTFNQPGRLNAVRRDMWEALPDAVTSLAKADGVRAIVVRGAGDQAFISGADIAEFDVQRNDAAANRPFTAAVTAATQALLTAPLPVIAMIKGYCIGGGMVVATACDIRICAQNAKFGVPAGKLGLGYELDNLARLQAIVGRGEAMEMLMTARHYSAAEALRIRLVNHVVEAGALERSVREMVAAIATLAPLTLAAAKIASLAATDPSLRDRAQEAVDRCFDSADFREGRAAFRERRVPAFRGL